MQNTSDAKFVLNNKLGGRVETEKLQAHQASELAFTEVRKIIKNALVRLPALTTVAVVDVAAGTSLGHHTRSRNFNATLVAATHAEMVRQKQQSLVALNMRGERLEDILMPFRKQLHLIRVSKNGQWFVFLDVKAQDTCLALAREILKSITA